MISPIRKNDKQNNEPRVLPLDCYKTEIISPIRKKSINKRMNPQKPMMTQSQHKLTH